MQARSEAAAAARPQRDLDEISAEHVKLTELRREAWDAKKGIVSRREPGTPDWVEAPVGPQESTRFGRVFGVVGALLFAAAVPLAWIGYHRAQRPIEIDVADQRVVEFETDDGRRRCVLEILVDVENGEDAPLEVRTATAVIDRRRVVARYEQGEVAARVGGTIVLHALVAPISPAPCPGINELDRGRLSVELRHAIGPDTRTVRRTARL